MRGLVESQPEKTNGASGANTLSDKGNPNNRGDCRCFAYIGHLARYSDGRLPGTADILSDSQYGGYQRYYADISFDKTVVVEHNSSSQLKKFDTFIPST